MTDDQSKVDEILKELELSGKQSDTTSPSEGGKSATSPGESLDRLEKLQQVGAITDEEYEILRTNLDAGDGKENEFNEPSNSESFGAPLTTSEGTDMDFSIIGVFEDVDTTKLVLPEYVDNLDEEDISSQYQGGPGRTLIFWQIFNHSNQEIKLKHKHIEHIGEDKIAYNYDGNALQTDRFEPGWRTDNWVDISADIRIKYVSLIEMPVQLDEVKIDGYCSDVHKIKITNEMRFPKSELPVTIDL